MLQATSIKQLLYSFKQLLQYHVLCVVAICSTYSTAKSINVYALHIANWPLKCYWVIVVNTSAKCTWRNSELLTSLHVRNIRLLILYDTMQQVLLAVHRFWVHANMFVPGSPSWYTGKYVWRGSIVSLTCRQVLSHLRSVISHFACVQQALRAPLAFALDDWKMDTWCCVK